MEDGRQLTEEQSLDLFALIRATIAHRFDPSTAIPPCPDDVFMIHRGAFVTIKLAGSLRGCIGRIEAHDPLWQVIGEMAIAAAFQDPRFPPMSRADLEDVEIEISVLGPLELIKDFGEIVVGTHGLFIRKGLRSGLLLPQVASSRNWDVTKFLCETCRKAGLNKDDWKKKADVYMFTADVFDEPAS